MKKMKLFLALILISFASFAQSDSEHLIFKGVPIDGTLSQYVEKMESAGFSYIGTKDDIAILQGDFAGFKNCSIGVTTLKAVNVVSTIVVTFPECEDWSCLEQRYEYLKSMLSQKYGEPTEVVEQFQGYPEPNTNNDKLDELYMDRCTWQTTYETPKGDIELFLQKGDYPQYYVVLRYFDKINTDKVRSSAMDDL